MELYSCSLGGGYYYNRIKVCFSYFICQFLQFSSSIVQEASDIIQRRPISKIRNNFCLCLCEKVVIKQNKIHPPKMKHIKYKYFLVSSTTSFCINIITPLKNPALVPPALQDRFLRGV